MPARHVLLSSILWVLVGLATSDGAIDPDPNRFADEIETFAQWDSKNAVPAEPVLFVGSSSIRMWKTREAFPELPVVNRGFGGSHISDVIHYLDRVVLPYRPKVIVFYAGDNDIAGKKSAEHVLNDYRRFVTLVHKELPKTRIAFITIKPSGQRWSLWPEMDRANDLIAEYSRQDDRLFFADLGTPLLGADDRPKSDLFLGDQLHLNPQGYAVWTAALRPTLSRVLTAE